MKCKCEAEMKALDVADNPNEGYAFNLYICNSCDTVAKKGVWNNAGITWLMTDGKIFKEIQ